MTTLSEALGGGMPPRQPGLVAEEARVDAYARASVDVTEGDGKIGGWVRSTATGYAQDIRSAWWMPASLPTVRAAWERRIPDRDTVPGGNAVLYHGWVAYNHTVGLAVPAVATALIGVLAAITWLAAHPARLVLAVLIGTALAGLIFI